MHTHPLALNVFKFLRGDEKAEKTLRKLAANELIIAGTGANDWLDSSGEAKRVDGGYRVTDSAQALRQRRARRTGLRNQRPLRR